jgi:hypothetical protein
LAIVVVNKNGTTALIAGNAAGNPTASKPVPTESEILAQTPDSAPPSSLGNLETATGSPLTSSTEAYAENPTQCTDDMAKKERDYNKEIAREKEMLNIKLSPFDFGINISSNIVEDYNIAVTDLLNRYTAAAKEKNCSFPVKQPALLPSTYHP